MFYMPPNSVPAQPGSLIRTAPVSLVTAAGAATATRIMYSTIDSMGRPSAVSGAIVEPTAPWNGPGTRPVVAFASGTIGSGLQCAPSYGLENPIVASVENGNASVFVDYDLVQIAALVGAGYTVAVTDYIGLGIPGRPHTYLNRVDTGHALLDAVRAASHLPKSPVTSTTKVGLWGYSQGGSASGAAAELQPAYAPELDVVGAYVGAPAADVNATLVGLDGKVIASAIGYEVAGLMESYPSVAPILEAELNEHGKAVVRDVSTRCLTDSSALNPFAQSSSWTNSGKPVPQVLAENARLRTVVDEQRLGRVAPVAPVLMTTSRSDGIAPHKMVERLAVDWCSVGAVTAYVPVSTPPAPGDTDELAVHHFLGTYESLPIALQWFRDRIAGAPAPTDCGGINAGRVPQ